MVASRASSTQSFRAEPKRSATPTPPLKAKKNINTTFLAEYITQVSNLLKRNKAVGKSIISEVEQLQLNLFKKQLDKGLESHSDVIQDYLKQSYTLIIAYILNLKKKSRPIEIHKLSK